MAVITIPYKPRPLQKVIHDAMERYRRGVVVCHRRFGKTVCAVNQLQKGAVTCTRQHPPPRFGYIAPTYAQGKAIAWNYMKHYAAPIPGVRMHESELRIDYPKGGQVRIFGADDPDRLRGLYFDGVVLDEYGLMRPNTFSEVVGPTLMDYNGWALFLGTPNGKNQFYKLLAGDSEAGGGGWPGARHHNEWFVAEYKASDTDLLPADDLAAARASMTADEYAQEYECNFEASVKGAVFAQELALLREEGRIQHVPYLREYVVDTCWDIGYRDATAIWFIQSPPGGAIRVIDYHEDHGRSLEEYATVLQQKGYRYGSHVFPHDIAQHEWTTGKSRIERASEILQPVGVMRQELVSFDDSLHEGRLALKKAWFDEQRCAEGLEALSAYHWHFNTQIKAYTRQPEHDWASHGSDAWRPTAMWHTSPMRIKPMKRERDEVELAHVRMLRRQYGYRPPRAQGPGGRAGI